MAQPPYQPPQQGYQQPAQQSWGQPTPATGPWTGKQKLAGGLLIGGALLAILGCFLPWVSVSAAGFDESFNAFVEGASDGYIVVVFAVVAIIFGALSYQPNPPRRGVITLGIIVGAVILLLGLANLGNIEDEAPGIEIFGGDISPGIGLILVTVSGLIILAGAIIAIIAQRSVNKLSGSQGGGRPYSPQGYQQPPQGYQQPGQAPPGQYQPPQQQYQPPPQGGGQQ